jgi:hypothetical protein
MIDSRRGQGTICHIPHPTLTLLFPRNAIFRIACTLSKHHRKNDMASSEETGKFRNAGWTLRSSSYNLRYCCTSSLSPHPYHNCSWKPLSDFPLSDPPPTEAFFRAMASTRPRRSLPATSYKGMMNSDSEDSESASSDSDLSEDSNEGYSASPDQVRNTSIQRIPFIYDLNTLPENFK